MPVEEIGKVTILSFPAGLYIFFLFFIPCIIIVKLGKFHFIGSTHYYHFTENMLFFCLKILLVKYITIHRSQEL